MAGLSSLTADTSTAKTELPSWYTGAQQQAVDMARQGALATPTAEQTVGQQSVDLLQNSNNPFASAQNTLGGIAQSASTPFITDENGNQVANPESTFGQLYDQQNRTLMDTILPAVDAQSTASAIGSGNFGSLRGLTAANKARGDAYNTLASNQLQNALTAAQTGTQAATQLSNVGAQNIDQALKVGQWQQVSPLAPASAFGKVLSGLGTTGNTVTNTANTSPLKTAGLLGTAAVDSPLARGAIGAVLGQDLSKSSTADVLSKLWGGITGKGGSRSSPSADAASSAGTYQLDGGGSLVLRPDGSQTIYGGDGSITNYDTSGNVIAPAAGYEGNFNTGTIQDQQEAENAANGYDDLGYSGGDYGYGEPDYSYSEPDYSYGDWE